MKCRRAISAASSANRSSSQARSFRPSQITWVASMAITIPIRCPSIRFSGWPTCLANRNIVATSSHAAAAFPVHRWARARKAMMREALALSKNGEKPHGSSTLTSGNGRTAAGRRAAAENSAKLVSIAPKASRICWASSAFVAPGDTRSARSGVSQPAPIPPVPGYSRRSSRTLVNSGQRERRISPKRVELLRDSGASSHSFMIGAAKKFSSGAASGHFSRSQRTSTPFAAHLCPNCAKFRRPRKSSNT